MSNSKMIQSYGFRPVVMYVDTDQDLCRSWGGYAYKCDDVEVKDDNNWVVYKCMYCNHNKFMQSSCLALTTADKRCRREADRFGYCSQHHSETTEVYAAAIDVDMPWKVETLKEYVDQAKKIAMSIAKRDILRQVKLIKDLSLGALYERIERNQQDCYIYFLKCGDYVKIGSSFSPETRIAQLKKENDTTLRPRGLKIEEAVCLGWVQGVRSLERDLHQALNRYRENGEWFRWTPKVESVVTDIIADELNVKDAVLRAIEDPRILDRLNDEDTVVGHHFIEKEIERVNEELEELLDSRESSY
jgi:hypothetical protein